MNSCKVCNSNTNNNKFCSRSCAASYNNSRRKHSKETKNKISESLKKSHAIAPRPKKITFFPIKICLICNSKFSHSNKYCSRSCGHIATGRARGKISASKRIRRSKDEIALYEMVKTHFSDAASNYIIADGWDADIVIFSKKTAILWNGPWHYKQLNLKNHSLLQVQTRDKIKIKVFKELGWKVYIFEDRHFTPETAFQKLVAETGFAPISRLL